MFTLPIEGLFVSKNLSKIPHCSFLRYLCTRQHVRMTRWCAGSFFLLSIYPTKSAPNALVRVLNALCSFEKELLICRFAPFSPPPQYLST